MLRALTLLLLCQLGGEAFVRFAALQVPGPVAGMVLLFIILALTKGATPEIQDTATGILSNLSLLFVPAGVGVMQHAARIHSEWVAVSLTLVLSTWITLIVVAAVFVLTARAMKLTTKDAGDSRNTGGDA